jgi:signal transduction histidine kinase
MAGVERGRDAGAVASGALDALPTQVAILDSEGVIVDTNRTWRTFGTANGVHEDPGMEGVNYLETCAESGDELGGRAADGIRDVLLGRRDEFTLEYPCHGPDERRWFSMRATAFEYGEEPHALVVHLNVTRRKRAELRVADKNDQLEALTRVLSADLGEDLEEATDAIAAHVLRAEEIPPELEDAQAALERMEDLLDDALVLARGSDITPERVEVGRVARRVWDGADTGDARLSVGEPPAIDADAELIEQIVGSLVENAVEHGSTGERGTKRPDDAVERGSTGEDVPLTVRVEAVEDGFAVADDGAGIEAERREHVFDAGYTTGRFNSGLGLTVVDQLARAHGWDVSLDAEGPGTRVEITGLSHPQGVRP